MMSRLFLLLLLFILSSDGQFLVWDASQQVWCTDWSLHNNLKSKLTEHCNNLRVCLLNLLNHFFEEIRFLFILI
jgi:hypothetical protein